MHRFTAGAILIAIGVILLLDRLEIIQADLGDVIRTWWPLILIYFGLSALRRRHLAGAGILLAIGAFLLGSNLGFWRSQQLWNIFWPVLLIGIGLALLLRAGRWEQGYVIRGGRGSQMFGDQRLAPEGELGGLSLWTGFGDLKLDLSRATLPPGETRVAVSGWFGDTSVYVPERMAVAVEATLIAGDLDLLGRRVEGFNLKERQETPGFMQAERRLLIRADRLFGEITVRRWG